MRCLIRRSSSLPAGASLIDAEDQYLKRVLREIDREIGRLNTVAARREGAVRAEEAWMAENLPKDGSNVFDTAQALDLHQQTLRSREEAATRLQRLTRQRGRPYFGSFTFRALTPEEDKEIERVYLGTGSIRGSGGELLVHDWRTPLASLYYDAEPGLAGYDAPQGRITGELGPKRQYQIADGTLLSVAESGVYIGDELLRDAITGRVGAHLHHIVETIQREQNEAIRHSGRGTLVVSGPAGSGKTSVALQRIAYLLFRDRAHLAARQVVFLSPNPLFSQYVSTVLPELGEENPETLTFEHLLQQSLPTVPFETAAAHYDRLRERPPAETERSRFRFRASSEFLALLNDRLAGLKREGIRFHDWGPDRAIWVSGATFFRWWQQGDRRGPLDVRLTALKERARRVAQDRIRRAGEEGVPGHVVEQGLLMLERFDFVDWAGMLAAFVGDDTGSRRLASGRALSHEDAVAVSYLKAAVLEPTTFANIQLVVVDEAQDYTATHYGLLRQLFRHADFTLVGDLDQAVDPYLRLSAWSDAAEALRSPFEGSKRRGARVLSLVKSYRSAPGVMRYATRLLPPEVGTHIEIMDLGRESAPPVFLEVEPAAVSSALLGILQRELQAGTKTLLLAARTAFEAGHLWAGLQAHVPVTLVDDARRDYPGGFVVMPLYLAKGLEFQTVVIGNASRDHFSNPDDARWLYVAITRSLNRVYIVSSGPRSRLFPPL